MAFEHLTNRSQGKLCNLCVSLPREQLCNKRQPSGEVFPATTNCCLLLAPSLPNSKRDDQGSSASQSVTSGYWGGSSPGTLTLLPSAVISILLSSCLGCLDPDFQVPLVSVAVARSHYTKPTQNSNWISLPADRAHQKPCWGSSKLKINTVCKSLKHQLKDWNHLFACSVFTSLTQGTEIYKVLFTWTPLCLLAMVIAWAFSYQPSTCTSE